MRRTATASLLAIAGLALLAGCDELTGSEGGDTGDFGRHDGSAFTSRCVVVVATEFGAGGSVAVIDADTYEVASDLTAVHHDSLVRVFGERVFVVNRLGADSIQELDPQRGFATLWQRSVGAGANPWDIALSDDGTALVPLYADGSLIRVDANKVDDGDFLVDGPVQLPVWTDDDEKVEPGAVFIVDGVAYAMIQGLDDYPVCLPESRGYLHAYDPDTLEPAPAFTGSATLELAACNPTSYAIRGDGTVAFTHSGVYRSFSRGIGSEATDDGGLEVVDLRNGHTSGLVVTEAELGNRDIFRVAFGEQGRVWVALANDDFSVTVHRATLDDTFELGPEVWTSPGGGIFDIEERWGRVWIADRTPGEEGVVVLDAVTGLPASNTLDTGFPPLDIDFVEVSGPCAR